MDAATVAARGRGATRDLGGAAGVDARALAAELRTAVRGEVRFDEGSRALYATDASNYRQVPIGVVVPRTVDALIAALGVCHHHGVPVLVRGGGTSLAGQTCNHAVVIDVFAAIDQVLANPGRFGFTNVTTPDHQHSGTTALYDSVFHFGQHGADWAAGIVLLFGLC